MAKVEWWILPVDGSISRRFEGFASRNVEDTSVSGVPNAWIDNFVYFCAGSGGSRNLWRIALDPNRLRLDAPAERLTFGTATESTPSAALLPTGGVRVVFASESSNYDIWSLPVDANRGRVLGDLQRITDDPSADVRPTVSADGRKMVFRSDRTGTGEIWIRDLVTGKETMLSSGPGYKHHSALSPDGSTVVYAVAADPRSCYSVPSTGGRPEKIGDGCYVIEDFTPDGKGVTFGSPAEDPKHLFAIFLVDLASKKRTAVLSHPKWDLWGQKFAPDGRWIAFHATEASQMRGVYIAPFRADGNAPPETWIAVSEPQGEQERWSPDGNLLYYLSKRDGFQCLWARRLDSQTKRPVASEFPVYHSHSVRRSLGNVPTDIVTPAVIQGKIFLTQNEITSNLWIAELPARR
jgi:dipeptidyl aminopeptidase/acylaminoacyl peptidase